MAQIIKHRRGTVGELSSYGSLQKGELAVTTGSVSGLTTPILQIGGGANNYVVGRLLNGASVPDVSANSEYNNLLFLDTGNNILYRLSSAGNSNIDLTGNIADRTITGTLATTGNFTTSGNISASGHLSASSVYADGDIYIGGNIVLGDASTDSLTIGADVSSSFLPNNDNAFDLGTSSKQWKDLYLSGTISASMHSGSFYGDGSGLTSIGTITAGDVAAILPSGTVSGSIQVDHDATTNFVSNEHIDHTAVTLTAGTGLFGGGDISTNRTFTVDSGSMSAYYSSSAFSRVSGDVVITSGGVATIQANSVVLGTDTTGNYMTDLSAGALIDITHSPTEGSTGTVAVDLTEAGEAAIVDGDYILFLDGGATGTHAKESITDVATLFAGTGLTAASSVIGVDYGSSAGSSVQGNTTITVSGTANEIEITGTSAQALGGGPSYTVGLPDSVTVATMSISQNLSVTGDLTVNGTTTTVNSTEVNIGDRILTLNAGSAVADGGLNVIDVSGSAGTGSLLWNAASDYWYTGVSGSTHYKLPQQSTNGNLTEDAILISDVNGRIESYSGLKLGGAITASVAISSSANIDADGYTEQGSNTLSNDISGNATTATTATNVAGGAANRVVYNSASGTTSFITAPATSGDVLQWNGSSMVWTTTIDGGTF